MWNGNGLADLTVSSTLVSHFSSITAYDGGEAAKILNSGRRTRPRAPR